MLRLWWLLMGSCMPFYQQIAHLPLFIYDPRSQRQNVRNDHLVQTIDLAPTLLDYFGVDIPPDMQGIPLREALASGAPTQEAGLFGVHGGHVNITDGRYVYTLGDHCLAVVSIASGNGSVYQLGDQPLSLFAHSNGCLAVGVDCIFSFDVKDKTIKKNFMPTNGYPFIRSDGTVATVSGLDNEFLSVFRLTE